MKAKPGSIIATTLFLCVLAAVAEAGSPDNGPARSGDINADGSLDLRDMHGLARCIAGLDSATPAADLDGNGRVDFRDLLLFINMTLAMRERQPEEPRFIVAVGSHVLDSPSVTPGVAVNEDGTGSTDYRFISDRPLQHATLSIEPYYFIGSTDSIRNMQLLADTGDLSSEVVSSPRRWQARAIDSDGRVSEQSGDARFYFYKRGVLVDNAYPLIGLPLEFPLVLHGPWQRFQLKQPAIKESWEPDSYLVDLNPSGADSVVFESLGSLARAIMDNLVERYPTPDGQFRAMIAGPAVPGDSSYSARGLIILGGYRGGAVIEPLDGNHRLLQQLGFPAWLRPELPGLMNGNYGFPEGWKEEYIYKYNDAESTYAGARCAVPPRCSSPYGVL